METDQVILRMSELAADRSAKRLCLFGSRARGDFRPGSDYNFALWGVPEEERPRLLADVEGLPTLSRLHLVFVSPATPPKLWERIRKEGVVLMDRFESARARFKQAQAQLREGLLQYARDPGGLAGDGVLRRFIFACEWAWRTTREYLLDEGYWELNSPKTVMRQALAEGLILDGDGWLRLLTDYERAARFCDGAAAAEILRGIQDVYMDLLTALAEKTEKTE